MVSNLLECVVNVSEGRDEALVRSLAASCGPVLLDAHRDPDHNRAVLSLGGPAAAVLSALKDLVAMAVERIDISRHNGAHPRLGAVDVVPFIGLGCFPLTDDAGVVSTDALAAREEFGRWLSDALSVPVFLYGPERTLPEVRRRAWKDLAPDMGPSAPHPTAGAACVGARSVLVAYNIWLERPDLSLARELASELRSPEVRALGLRVGREVQVSFNLVAPWRTGPAQVWDAVCAVAPAVRGELVGLLPQGVLAQVPQERWAQLGLSAYATIESALARRGCLPGSGGQ